MLTTVPLYVYSSGKEQDIELLRLCQQQPGLAWCGAGRLVPLVQQDPDIKLAIATCANLLTVKRTVLNLVNFNFVFYLCFYLSAYNTEVIEIFHIASHSWNLVI